MHLDAIGILAVQSGIIPVAINDPRQPSAFCPADMYPDFDMPPRQLGPHALDGTLGPTGIAVTSIAAVGDFRQPLFTLGVHLIDNIWGRFGAGLRDAEIGIPAVVFDHPVAVGLVKAVRRVSCVDMDGGAAGGTSSDPPNSSDARILGGQQDFPALIAHFLAVYHVPAVYVRGPPLGVAAGVLVSAVAAGNDDLGAVQRGIDGLQKRQ